MIRSSTDGHEAGPSWHVLSHAAVDVPVLPYRSDRMLFGKSMHVNVASNCRTRTLAKDGPAYW